MTVKKRQLHERVEPRSRPQQERSRIRYQALLDAAEITIAEAGLDGLQMREVARRANLPIASVYHYFPSSASLISALAQKHLETLGGILEKRLLATAPLNTTNLDIEQASLLIDDLAGFFFQTPSLPMIWRFIQVDPDLRKIDMDDTFKNADQIQRYLTHFYPGLDAEQARMTALVLIQMVMSTLTFAIDTPADMREKLLETLKSMLMDVLRVLPQKS